MAEITFNFQQANTVIQCNIDDKMKDICNNFCKEIKKDINQLFFIYDGSKIDLEKSLREIANQDDIISKKMIILANENSDNSEEEKKQSIIKSKYVICPKCYEHTIFQMKKYKISLHECKNGDTTNDINLDQYQNTQNIDLSKIFCENCKEVNQLEAFNNIFYLCFSCQKKFRR